MSIHSSGESEEEFPVYDFLQPGRGSGSPEADHRGADHRARGSLEADHRGADHRARGSLEADYRGADHRGRGSLEASRRGVYDRGADRSSRGSPEADHRGADRRGSREADLVVLDDSSDTDAASPSSLAEAGGPREEAGAMMLSEDSEEDAPYVPLALRLKQRQQAPGLPGGGPPAPGLLPPRGQPGHPQPRPRGRAGGTGAAEERTALKPWPPPITTTTAAACPAQSTGVGQPPQTSREEVRRRRDRGDKENRKVELDRQKAERKAQQEAAKALRPEECIKHMVVVVDPGNYQTHGGGPR